MINKPLRTVVAAAIGFGALVLDEDLAKGPSLTTAQAVIGRPFTPMSYAGVARRTTRRAAYAGAYAGAYAAPPVYAAAPAYAPGCVQVVDAYGQIVTRC